MIILKLNNNVIIWSIQNKS